MERQARTAHALDELIAISREGRQFYEEAASKVGDASLAALFLRLAAVKSDLVTQLGALAQTAGELSQGALLVQLRHAYGEVRAALGDRRHAYVAELEASEGRLLRSLDELSTDGDTPAYLREAGQRLLPEVRACHALMRQRKEAQRRAA